MFRVKKALSFILVAAMTISIVRTPIRASAAAPGDSGIDTLKPATFDNMQYKLKPNIKEIPSAISYNTQLMDLPDLMGKEINIKSAGTDLLKSPLNISSPLLKESLPSVNGLPDNSLQGNSQIDPSKIDLKDLKYPIGASYMILNKDVSSFMPAAGEIYLDAAKKSAVKVAGTPLLDPKSGKRVVPVTKPAISEIFESYKVPEQSVVLNKANVAYTIPATPDEDGASYINIQQGYTAPASAATAAMPGMYALPSVKTEGDALVVTLKNITLYEYPDPSKDDKDKDKKEEKDNKDPDEFGSEDYDSNKEGEPGYYESKDGNQPQKQNKEEEKDTKVKDPTTDLNGVEDKSKLTIKVKVEEAKLVIHKPEAFASIDIGPITQDIKIGYKSNVESEITIKGELKFDKVIETCIFGYNLDLPFGRAFIGVFLVLDAKGEVTVKSKIISTSEFQAGLTAQAVLFVPVYVGPYAEPVIKTVNVGFTADGKVTAKAALVPQVGLIICDYEVGVLQLWLAMTADAKFHIEGEGGVDVENITADGKISGEGELKIGAYAELVAYLLGSRYSLFYKDWKIYEGKWSVGQEAGGGASSLKPIKGTINLEADAYENAVRGSVRYYDDTAGNKSVGGGNLPWHQQISFGTEVKQGKVKITIKHKDGTITGPVEVRTDNMGEFEADESTIGNLTPEDFVTADINETVKDGEGNDRSLIYQTAAVAPTVPFDKITFVPDAFNDVVLGTVSGDYTGPLVIEKVSGSTITRKMAQATDGKFSYEVPLVGGDKVNVYVSFEGVNYPKDAKPKDANLDALKIYFGVDKINSIVYGSVQNMASEYPTSYKGNIKITDAGQILGSQAAKPYTTRVLMRDPQNKYGFIWKEIENGASTFRIPIQLSLKFALTIEHDGITKTVKYDPMGDLLNKLKATKVEDAITNPIDDIIDSVVNPGDISIWQGVWEFDQLGTVVMNVSGNKITGTYDDGYNTIEATISGDKISGVLKEGEDSYKFDMFLPQNGKTYRAVWYEEGSSRGVNLSGTKLKLPSENVLSKNINLKSWTGIWYSDLGTVLLSQEGSKVTGSYGENRYTLSGTVEGNMLRGTFAEGDLEGEFEFELLPDGRNFEGMYRYYGDDEWSSWGDGQRHMQVN